MMTYVMITSSVTSCIDLKPLIPINLFSGTRADRIASAQCLALADRTDAKVIDLLIKLLLETSDAKQREQATNLLIHISKNTVGGSGWMILDSG